MPSARRHGPWLGAALWLLAAAGFVALNASRALRVGRMFMQRDQVAALAVAIVLLVTLLGLWLWLGWRATLRRLGQVLAPAWVDRRVARVTLLGLLGLTAVTFAYARWVEPRLVVVRTVHLGATRAGQADPVRIAVISDLHIDGTGEPWIGLPARIRATSPDVVVLLGDTLNRAASLPMLARVLGPIEAPFGKYAVRGNWDVWYWSDLPLLEGTGFRWLDHELVSLEIRGQTVHLLGWGYRDNVPATDAEPLLAGLGPDHWRVFLDHMPDQIADVPSADLALVGHTHGGQIWLPGFGPLVTLSRYGRRFARGLAHFGRTAVYTNPGIGVEPLVPLRLGVRPEITLVELGPKLGDP